MAGFYTNINLYLIWMESNGSNFEVMIQRMGIAALMILMLYLDLFFLMKEYVRVCLPDLSVLFLCGFVWREIIRKYMYSLLQYEIPLILAADVFFVVVLCAGNTMSGILCAVLTGGIMAAYHLVCLKVFALAYRWKQKEIR